MISFRQADLFRTLTPEIGRINLIWDKSETFQTYNVEVQPEFKDILWKAFVDCQFNLNLKSERDIRAFKVLGDKTNPKEEIKKSVNEICSRLLQLGIKTSVETIYGDNGIIRVTIDMRRSE